MPGPDDKPPRSPTRPRIGLPDTTPPPTSKASLYGQVERTPAPVHSPYGPYGLQDRTPPPQQYPSQTGIPVQPYPEHVSTTINAPVAVSAPSPAHQGDDLSLFARWWKQAVIIAAGAMTVGAVIWAVGTLLFVPAKTYDADRFNMTLMQNKIDELQRTLQTYRDLTQQMRDDLNDIKTKFSIMEAVQQQQDRDRRNGNRNH